MVTVRSGGVSMKRILLKLSGEALAKEAVKPDGKKESYGFDEDKVMKVVRQIQVLVQEGLQIGIVIGGGNFWRGRTSGDMDRVRADQIGMLATVMNCMYVSDRCRALGLQTSIYTPFICGSFTRLYAKDEVDADFAAGKVLFFAGGTGHPYFSTDTATALRAVEIGADAILVAKNVDGIYDSDPRVNPDARKYDEITIDKVIADGLQAMDIASAVICKENGMSMLVFPLQEENSILRAARGEAIGTRVIAAK